MDAEVLLLLLLLKRLLKLLSLKVLLLSMLLLLKRASSLSSEPNRIALHWSTPSKPVAEVCACEPALVRTSVCPNMPPKMEGSQSVVCTK